MWGCQAEDEWSIFLCGGNGNVLQPDVDGDDQIPTYLTGTLECKGFGVFPYPPEREHTHRCMDHQRPEVFLARIRRRVAHRPLPVPCQDNSDANGSLWSNLFLACSSSAIALQTTFTNENNVFANSTGAPSMTTTITSHLSPILSYSTRLTDPINGQHATPFNDITLVLNGTTVSQVTSISVPSGDHVNSI